jgi:hypothetical protein
MYKLCPKSRFLAVLSVSILLVLFAGCGDFDMITGANGYSVSGLVDGISLDDCSIIKESSKIQPYFDCNISDDSDTSALRVLIEDRIGKPVGSPLVYMLPEGAESPSEQQNSALKETSGGKTGDQEQKISAEVSGEGSESETQTESAGEKEAEPEGKTKTEGDSEKTVTEAPVKDLIITVKNFENLPPFSFPEGLEAGIYSISFQIINHSGGVLQSIEKYVYYIANETFAITDIQSYLPGVAETPHVLPPEAPILLEARIESDPGIQPYIVWYCGKKVIAEGEVTDGIYRFLWDSPVETGFQTIKAEVFPFDPNTAIALMRGISKEMSLPVSFKHGRHGYFSEKSGEFSNWYKFWGNVNDTKDIKNEAKALVAVSKKPPLWLPYSGTYGLAVGAFNVWELPETPFMPILDGKSARFLFRFAPRNDGNFATAQIFDANTGLPHSVQLALNGGILELTSEQKGVLLRAEAPLNNDSDGFVCAALEFKLAYGYIFISIITDLSSNEKIEETQTIQLKGHPDGKGSIFLGENLTESANRSIIAIISEIAVSYPEVRAIEEETEENEANDVAEAQETNSGDSFLSTDINS